MPHRVRISESIRAVLRPEDIPSPESSGEDHLRGRFGKKFFTTSDGFDYYLNYINRSKDRRPDMWSISFFDSGGGESPRKFEVIQHVAAKVRDIIAEVKPKYLFFDPISDSRHKLFKTLMRHLLPEAKLVSDPDEWALTYSLPGSREAVFQDFPEVSDWEDQELDFWSRDFETSDGEEFQISFSDEGRGEWLVTFGVWNEEGALQHTPTGKGNQWEVYQQVLGSIKKFSEEVRPRKIRLQGATDKQHDLYRAMAKKLVPLGYRQVGEDLVLFRPQRYMRDGRKAVLRTEEIPPSDEEGFGFLGGEGYERSYFTTTDGIKYKVVFNETIRGLGGQWEVIFYSSPSGQRSEKPFEVMRGVAAKVRDFINVKSPNYLVMAPTSPSRRKLYKAMMTKFIPEAELRESGNKLFYQLPGAENSGRMSRVVAGIRVSDVRFVPPAWKRKYGHSRSLDMWDWVLESMERNQIDPIQVDYEQIGELMRLTEQRYFAQQGERQQQGTSVLTDDSVTDVGEYPPQSAWEGRSARVAAGILVADSPHFFVSPNVVGFDGEWGREFDPDEPCVNCVVPTKESDTGQRRERTGAFRSEEIPDATPYEELPETGFQGNWENIDFEFTTSDGVEYYVSFEKLASKEDEEESGENTPEWEVSFGIEEAPPGGWRGSKHWYEVMRGVAAKIRDFIENWNPQKIEFVPTSPSRRKLYLTMLRRFLPNAKIDDSTAVIEVIL